MTKPRNENEEGFKETLLEQLPTQWKVQFLDEIAVVTMGQSPDSKYYNIVGDGLPLIQGNADCKNGSTQPRFWTTQITKTCDPGDLILSVRAPVGPVAKSSHHACIGRGVCAIKPTQDSNYLFHFLVSLENKWGKISQGSTFDAVTSSQVKKLRITVPPIEEQEKISAIVSVWDRAIEQVQRLIEAKQRQKIKLVSQLLSGQKRFPGFQDEWQQVKLGSILHPKFRKVVKPAGAYLRLGIRSHGKGTFTSVVDDPETIALTHLFQTRKDDLIVNITFAWEGAIALVGPDGDGALVSHRFPTYVFDTSKILPEYFKHLMVTDRFFYELDLISPGGAGRNRVMNKGDFLKILVTIPGVEEQKKIAGVLGRMDEQIGLLKEYLEKLKAQKKGLMQKLLTGEIRVKVD